MVNDDYTVNDVLIVGGGYTEAPFYYPPLQPLLAIRYNCVCFYASLVYSKHIGLLCRV